MQPHMPIDSAINGIEIVDIPFKSRAGCALRIIAPIVDMHRQHIFFVDRV